MRGNRAIAHGNMSEWNKSQDQLSGQATLPRKLMSLAFKVRIAFYRIRKQGVRRMNEFF